MSCPPCNGNCSQGRKCTMQRMHEEQAQLRQTISTLVVMMVLGAVIAMVCILSPSAQAHTLGVHVATAHFGGHDLQPHTPGLYARIGSGPLAGLTLGGYRNSYGLQSRYVAYTWQTDNRSFALTAGAVTGYPVAPVMPLLCPSARIALGRDAALRVAFLPKPAHHGTAAGLHIAFEQEI